MKAPPIDANHDPCVRQQDLVPLEIAHIFISNRRYIRTRSDGDFTLIDCHVPDPRPLSRGVVVLQTEMKGENSDGQGCVGGLKNIYTYLELAISSWDVYTGGNGD
jgi:hypothetical protein